MSLTPKIVNAGAAPAINRLAGHTSSPTIDGQPVGEINTYSAIVHQRAGYQQEELLYERRRADQGQAFSRTRERSINTPMMTGTSRTFVEAFAAVLDAGGAGGGQTQAQIQTTSMSQGISSYEVTSMVIHDEMPPRGDNLSFSV